MSDRYKVVRLKYGFGIQGEPGEFPFEAIAQSAADTMNHTYAAGAASRDAEVVKWNAIADALYDELGPCLMIKVDGSACGKCSRCNAESMYLTGV